jgi:hypothetical protein
VSVRERTGGDVVSKDLARAIQEIHAMVGDQAETMAIQPTNLQDLPKRMKELERENGELKKMLAESLLEIRVLKFVCEKKL